VGTHCLASASRRERERAVGRRKDQRRRRVLSTGCDWFSTSTISQMNNPLWREAQPCELPVPDRRYRDRDHHPVLDATS
jgi:hypothetical protein